MTRLFRFKGLSAYIFCALFLSFPQMAYQLVFTMQADAVSLGFLASAISIKLFLKSAGKSSVLRRAIHFMAAALLFMFVIAVYQALAFVPLMIYAIVALLDTFNDNYTFKARLREYLQFGALVVAAIILYAISVKIFCPRATGGGYLSNYVSGESENLFLNFFRLLGKLFTGKDYYGNQTFIIATIGLVVLASGFFWGNRKLLFFRLVLLAGISLLPFVIAFFITGSYKPPRLYVASGIVYAFVIAYLCAAARREKLSFVFTALMVLTNIYFVTMLFWSQSKVYRHDIKIATDIDNTIRSAYPDFDSEKDYVYFYGCVPYAESEKFRLPGSEVFGGSFFVWDNGNNYRITNFMKFADVAHYRVIDRKEVYLKIKDSISTMPIWPRPGYVKRVDDVIIVRLGETKGAPLWIE